MPGAMRPAAFAMASARRRPLSHHNRSIDAEQMRPTPQMLCSSAASVKEGQRRACARGAEKTMIETIVSPDGRSFTMFVHRLNPPRSHRPIVYPQREEAVRYAARWKCGSSSRKELFAAAMRREEASDAPIPQIVPIAQEQERQMLREPRRYSAGR